jgi:hypothetical protein
MGDRVLVYFGYPQARARGHSPVARPDPVVSANEQAAGLIVHKLSKCGLNPMRVPPRRSEE